MSALRSKRTRGEATENDNPEELSNAGSQEIPGNGDTEIFSTLIPLMRNLNVLKTCRLVCKSWNQFACQAIRKLPRVFYYIEESDTESADQSLSLMLENKNLGLPSPFGNLTILADSFREKSFLQFLHYVCDNGSDYSIELCIHTEDENHADPVELQRVLTTNLNNFKITKLELARKIIGDGPGSDKFQPEKIRLPHLQTITILDEGLVSDKIVTLCENLCHHSPIKRIKIIEFTAAEKLKKVMTPGGMQSVERFYLACMDPISLEGWKYICERITEIPRIKRLKMFFPESFFINGSYYEEFKAIIEHFADSIETLKGDWLPVIKHKCFPQLREIDDSKFGECKSDFSFPVERYPLLKKATFGYHTSNALEYLSFDEQSPGIEHLSFKVPDVTDPDLILKFVYLAGKIFPNVSRFAIVQFGGLRKLQFTSSMLNVICKSFPKLTALDLRVNLKDDRILSGLRIIVEEWLEESWPLENIPRESSLLDFQSLEDLTLGAYVVITRHLFLYCLSKIPKLKYLTFYLNGDVSAVDVRDSVGHLKRVTVVILTQTIKPDEQWVEEMEQLQIMLPAVVEIKIKDGESQC